jgi:PII-like signaling protein
MELRGEAKLLRIFLGSQDKVNGKPLYEEIVFAAKKQGLAGATVLKGVMGYGANSLIHTTKILDISDEIPVVVEIIDEEEKISNFINTINPYFENSKYGGLITTEKVGVLYYKGSKG